METYRASLSVTDPTQYINEAVSCLIINGADHNSEGILTDKLILKSFLVYDLHSINREGKKTKDSRFSSLLLSSGI
jgi:hypothetical protein